MSNPAIDNPRQEVEEALAAGDLSGLLTFTGRLHGHFCPGSALGVMASAYGLQLLETGYTPSSGMEHLMAVVETNSCFADGVQVVSGCTLGNNSLVYRDLGRMAVSFTVRGERTGVRVRVRPDFRYHVEREVPEFFPLMDTVVRNREGTAEQEAAFKLKGREAAFALVRLPFEDILTAETVRPTLPEYAPIAASVTCRSCGEQTMTTKVVPHGEGAGLCLICSGAQYYQVEGKGIVARKGM
ncbi:MAG: FmdE family protein [Chloroflexota bacterium]|nr:FmdE family protein [Chloroflexota bacterium]